MKTIHACKKSPNRIFGFFMITVSSILIILNLISGYRGHFWEYYGPLISSAINLIAGFLFLYFPKCNRYFVKFDTDKLIFKTRKNKLTEVHYKDIEAPEIHIFEIKLPLKNGKSLIMNLDSFSYEQLRKVKQELLNRF